MLSDTLDIPIDLEGKVPCQDPATRGLFLTPDLDIDMDDPDYIALSIREKEQRFVAKEVAEEAAVAACSLCPMINACREWALQTYVHGVAGGLTEKQRRNGGVETPDVSRGARGAVPEDLVQAWSLEGHSTETIANRLDCSPRTVVRARRRAETGSSDTQSMPRRQGTTDAHATDGYASAPVAAKTALDFASLTPESLAMYDYLAHQNAPVNRKDVAQHIARFVTPDIASKWGANLPCAEDKKQQQGALKLARNRIDIAYRHGRVIRTQQGKETLLRLPSEIKRDYIAWQTAHTAVSA